MNIDPSEFLRQYHLGHADIGVGTSTSYFLVFTKSGGMFVRAVTDYDAAAKPAAVHEFRLADFPLLAINGRPMTEVVSGKLDDILPTGLVASSSKRYEVPTATRQDFRSVRTAGKRTSRP